MYIRNLYLTKKITSVYIKVVSEMHGVTSGACSVNKNNEKRLSKHGCLDASFSSYDP
jgi:hypothetical protein